jgi:hypothetical protein
VGPALAQHSLSGLTLLTAQTLNTLTLVVVYSAGLGVGLEDINGGNQLVQASRDLGTPRHLDINDGGRSIAVWTHFTSAQTRKQPLGWWFLFPDVGLAIELCDGALVSWDGRSVAHCTCVPARLPVDDHLYSLFFGVSSKTETAARKQREFELCVRARHLGCGGGVLVPGDHVWVRLFPESRPGTSMCRYRSAHVVSAERSSDVCVRWVKPEVGYCDGGAFELMHVVRAGAVGPLSDSPSGALLVGKRVLVFWPSEDRCYEGRIEGWDGVKHRTVYDDGDDITEVMGGVDAPYWLVLQS